MPKSALTPEEKSRREGFGKQILEFVKKNPHCTKAEVRPAVSISSDKDFEYGWLYLRNNNIMLLSGNRKVPNQRGAAGEYVAATT
jgi:hypothetical protein